MKRSDQFPQVREIADAVCIDAASDEQLKQLEQLLHGDFEAQRFYYDYISLHMRLKGGADRNTEFIYRRLSEEFVVRPKSEEEPLGSTIPPQVANQTNYSHRNRFIGIVIVVTLLFAYLAWLFYSYTKNPIVAEVVKGQVSIIEQGEGGSSLISGVYKAESDAILELTNGDTLHLEKHSVIKLFNNSELYLKQGHLKITRSDGNNTMIHGDNYIIHSNGSGLGLDLTRSSPLLSSGDNTVVVPTRWRPTHYWSFDGTNDRATDSIGSAHGVVAPGASRVDGIVGQAAFGFDNGPNARIELGSGGGTAPGTGSFSVTDGVTIEALLRPNFSGELNETDTIFRKDHGDKELRMVLSFQHDSGKAYLRPSGDFKESLSFGLFVLGQGYHELKLPLDGVNGRPTLADLRDGKYHHVVATYDVQSGLKAIYLDGKMLAHYQYPPGSKVISGGPGTATIGNNPASHRWQAEAFAGVIDEVAFYDFALTGFMLKAHLLNVTRGLNYFGLPPKTEPLPQEIKLYLPQDITVELDSLTGLPKRTRRD